MEEELDNWVKMQLPALAQGNEKVRSVFRMCVATVIYHGKWLEDNVHPNSAFRAAQLWNERAPFEEYVTVRHPWDATEDTPEITGLPPDVVLLNGIKELKMEVKELKAELKASFKDTQIKQLNQERRRRGICAVEGNYGKAGIHIGEDECDYGDCSCG